MLAAFRVITLCAVVSAARLPFAQSAPPIPTTRIPAGSYVMGADDATLSPAIVNGFGVMSARPAHGDFDEVPRHRVTISHPFAIATHLVTAKEFLAFDPAYKPVPAYPDYAAGISYNQAVAFCAWLSLKTGKSYRLPTEAEWEYVERAGSTTPFFTGDTPPRPGQPNAWGVVMGEGAPEWVADWYGPYPSVAQTDPTGPAHGYFRVVRGGGLDFRKSKPGESYPATAPYFMRSANRAGMAPDYASQSGNIGFRVVQAPSLAPHPSPAERFFFFTDVKQTPVQLTAGPDPEKPFYHVHELFPNLNGKSMPDIGWRAGLAPGLGINYHNSAVQVLANGDVVAAYYNTPNKEDDPDQTVMVMRRRAGAEDWDMPEPWPAFAHAACAACIFALLTPSAPVQSSSGGWGPLGFRVSGAPLPPSFSVILRPTARLPDRTSSLALTAAAQVQLAERMNGLLPPLEHRDMLRRHLLALDAADRYLRFGCAASDAQVNAYVDHIDFVRDEVYGVFNRRLQLIAAAHLALPGDGSAEFGVSVLPAGRGKGIGTRLFERAAIHARNRGIACLTMQCLTHNAPMVRIARRAGMRVHVSGSDTEGVLQVPPGDLRSRLDEWLEDATGGIDFALKLGRRRSGAQSA